MICLIPDRCWAGFALANRHDCCCHNRFTPSSTVWKRAGGGVCYQQGELLCISLTLFLAGLCRSCSDKLKTSANWRSCWSTQGWIAAVTQLVNYGTLPGVTQKCSLDLYIKIEWEVFSFPKQNNVRWMYKTTPTLENKQGTRIFFFTLSNLKY